MKKIPPFALFFSVLIAALCLQPPKSGISKSRAQYPQTVGAKDTIEVLSNRLDSLLNTTKSTVKATETNLEKSKANITVLKKIQATRKKMCCYWKSNCNQTQ